MKYPEVWACPELLSKKYIMKYAEAWEFNSLGNLIIFGD